MPSRAISVTEGAGRTRDLRALAGQHLDAMDGRAHRDVADRQRVAGLDRRLGADISVAPASTPRGAMM
jgi:hypothetical protein